MGDPINVCAFDQFYLPAWQCALWHCVLQCRVRWMEQGVVIKRLAAPGEESSLGLICRKTPAVQCFAVQCTGWWWLAQQLLLA